MHEFPNTLPEGARFGAGRSGPGRGAEDALPDIPFDPVPRLRVRRNGWSAERQRGFIAALTRGGCVAAAARVVRIAAFDLGTTTQPAPCAPAPAP